MKVLLVTDQYLRIINGQILGPANFTSIVKRLKSLGELHICLLERKDDSKSIQVYNDPLNEYVEKNNISFISKSYLWPSCATTKTLRNEIRKVDLVIGYVPALNAEFACQMAHRMGKKYFALMVACPWDGLWNQDWKRKIAAPYRFLMNRNVLRNADYALYVTNRFLQHRYPNRVGNSAGISDVVLEENHVGVLESRIKKIEVMIKDETIKLATIAMLNVQYKGQRFVIKALKKLKDRGFSNYHYYLIGGGDDSKLRALAVKFGVLDQVHFVGKLIHEEVFSLLDDMDIYVHPSLQEGLPRSVVEAMSRALPCIGARTAAIPELLDPHFVVKRKSVDEIVDRILELRDNKPLMIQQAKRNFEESKNYECAKLDASRNEFYNSIKKDFDEK